MVDRILPLVQTIEGKEYFFHSIAVFEATLEGITEPNMAKKEFDFTPFHPLILAVQHVTSEDDQGRFDVVDLVFGSSSNVGAAAYSVPAGAPNLGRYRTLFPHVQVDKSFNIARLYEPHARFFVGGVQNIEEDPGTTVTARFCVIAGLYTTVETKVVKALASKKMTTMFLEKKVEVGAGLSTTIDFLLDRPFTAVGINQILVETMASPTELQEKKDVFLTLDLPPTGLRDFAFKNFGEFQVLSERKLVFPLPIVGYGQRIPIKAVNSGAAAAKFNVALEVTCWED